MLNERPTVTSTVEEPIPTPRPAPERIERFPLRPAPRFSGGMLGLLGLSLLILLAAAVDPMFQSGEGLWLLLLLLTTTLFPILAGLFFRKSGPPGAIELWPDRVLLPITSGEASVSIRYREVNSLFLKSGRSGFLLIGTALGNFVFPLKSFEQGDDAPRLERAIRERIQALPDGDARVLAFDQKGAQAGATFAHPIRATIGVVAILGGIFLLQQFGGAFDQAFSIVRFGASARLLVLDGQWYRLFTGSLLHGSLIHVLLNGLAIHALGGAIERLYGSRNFLLIYLVAAVFGTGLSVLSNRAELSVGASTAAFGLLGAYAFTAYRYRDRMPTGFRPALRWWIFVIGINVAISLWIQVIDFQAHLGGFLGGVVVAALLLEGDPTLPIRGFRPLWSRIVLPLVIAAHLVAVGLAVNGYARGEQDENRIIAEHLEKRRGSSDSLNFLAWMIAVEPNSSKERLQMARTAALLGLERINEEKRAQEIELNSGWQLVPVDWKAFHGGYRLREQMISDTVATTEYRLGNLDAALDRELPILVQQGDPVIAAQAARFLAARKAQLGVRIEPDAQPIGTSSVGVTLSYESNRGYYLTVQAPTGIPKPIGVMGLVRSGDKLVGLLELRLDADTPRDRPLYLEQQNIYAAWPTDATFELAWIGRPRAWQAWSLDPSTLSYP